MCFIFKAYLWTVSVKAWTFSGFASSCIPTLASIINPPLSAKILINSLMLFSTCRGFPVHISDEDTFPNHRNAARLP
jgi:hypothetical protein